MVLFLDFDGCMHPEPCYEEEKLFSCRARFESVVRNFPSLDIVISSDWRHRRSLDELRGLFSPDVAPQIVGVTPNHIDIPDLVQVIGYKRQAECEGWLRQNGRAWEQDWVALDDRPWLFRPFCKNLVLCHPQTCFDDQVEHVLRQKFASKRY